MPDNLYGELPTPDQSPLEVGKQWLGAADVAASALSHAIMDVPAGLYGYGTGIATGNLDKAADAVQQARQFLSPVTYNPYTEAGQRYAQYIPQAIDAADKAIGNTLSPGAGMSTTELGNKYLGPGAMAMGTAAAGMLGGPEEGAMARAAESGEPAVVNIGLAIGEHNGGGTITPDMARAALEQRGVKVLHEEIGQSATEPTYIAKLSRPLSPAEGHEISADLKQDAIAQKHGDSGNLFGPKAEEWGPFNSDYFLTPQKDFETWLNSGPAGPANGRRAIRVVHGTASPEDFTEFDPTRSEGFIHVGGPSQANGRTEPITDPTQYNKLMTQEQLLNYRGYVPRSIPMYARALNPVRFRDSTGGWNAERMTNDLRDDGVITPQEHAYISEPYQARGLTPAMDDEARRRMIEVLEAKGYDSGVYLNRFEGVGTTDYDDVRNYLQASDAQFKDQFPNASDSYLFWDKTALKGQYNKTFDPKAPEYNKAKGGLVAKYEDGGQIREDIPPVTVTAPRWHPGTHMVYVNGSPTWVSSDPVQEAHARAALRYLDTGDTSLLDH